MHGCGASCLLDMGGQLLQGGRVIYKHTYQEELSVCVCVQHPCVYGTYKTQLVCTRHRLAQTAVCSRTCRAAAAEEPTSKLTGSESVYKREGQMPLERVCDQCWLSNRHN